MQALLRTSYRVAFVSTLVLSVMPALTFAQTVSPTIYGMYPAAGPIGTAVSIYGYGFTPSNTILLDGGLVANNVPISSTIAVTCVGPNCHNILQVVKFTVPASVTANCSPSAPSCIEYIDIVAPGKHAITVQNVNGTSNNIIFKVTKPAK